MERGIDARADEETRSESATKKNAEILPFAALIDFTLAAKERGSGGAAFLVLASCGAQDLERPASRCAVIAPLPIALGDLFGDFVDVIMKSSEVGSR